MQALRVALAVCVRPFMCSEVRELPRRCCLLRREPVCRLLHIASREPVVGGRDLSDTPSGEHPSDGINRVALLPQLHGDEFLGSSRGDLPIVESREDGGNALHGGSILVTTVFSVHRQKAATMAKRDYPSQTCVKQIKFAGETMKCGGPTEPDSRYCAEHSKYDDGLAAHKAVQEQKTKELYVPAPESTTIYQKVEEMIDRVLDFEEESRKAYARLQVDERRFVDDNGGEHLRSEVAVYERALDRSARVLKDVTKLGIESQLVRIRRMELDIVRSALTQTFIAMGMSKQQVNFARKVLAKKLREHDVDVIDAEVEEGDSDAPTR